MPRTYMGTVREPVKVDHTRALIKECVRAQGLHYADIAKDVGLLPGSLANKMSDGSDGFTIKFLRDIRRRIGIPANEMAKAIAEDLLE